MNIFLKRFTITFVAVMITSFFMVKLGAIGILLFIVVLLGGMYWIFKSVPNLLKGEDIPNGIPATATVISSRQGNMRMSSGVAQSYQLIIEANISDGKETWPATIKTMVSITQISVFQPGVQFAVKYDPNDRSKVVVNRDTSDQAQGQPQNQSYAIPGMGDVTSQMKQQSMMAAPQEITMKLVQQNELLAKFKNSSSAVTTTGLIKESKKIYTNYMQGADVFELKVEVNAPDGQNFTVDITFMLVATSASKVEVGKNIYVTYEPSNPYFVVLSGTDKPNSGFEIK